MTLGRAAGPARSFLASALLLGCSGPGDESSPANEDATLATDASPQPPSSDMRGPPALADLGTEPSAPLTVEVAEPRDEARTTGATIRLSGALSGGRRPYAVKVDPDARPDQSIPVPVDGATFAAELPAPADGAWGFVVVATDADGLTTRVVRRVTHTRLRPDTTAPVITLDSPAPNARVGRTVILEGQVVEPSVDDAQRSGLARLRIDERPVAVDAEGRFRTVVESIASGARTVTLEAVDVAGNVGTQSVALDVDLDPPAVNVVVPLEGERLVLRTVEVRLTADDVSTPVTVLVDGRPPSRVEPDGTLVVDLDPGSPGVQSISVEATDALGNTARSVRRFERVEPLPDVTPPVLRLDAPPPFVWYDDPRVAFAGSVTDELGHPDAVRTGAVALVVDDVRTPIADGPFAVEVEIGPGIQRVTVSAEDAAGNRSQPQELVLRIGDRLVDETPPELVVASPTPGERVYADVVTVTGSLADQGSGPRSVRIGQIEVPATDGRFSISVPDLPGGDQSLELEAFDWAGQRVTQRVVFTRRPETEGGQIAFTDITVAAFGDAALVPRASSDTAGIGVGAATVDLDGDGDLDLVNTGADRIGYDPATPPGVYENVGLVEGIVRFERRPDALEPPLDGVPVYAVAAGDPDADGDHDLYFCVDGSDRYYRNDGGRFVDATADVGLTDAGGRHAQATFADFDTDGFDDLYVSGFPTERAAQRSYPPDEPLPPRAMLFMNREGRFFEDVTARAGLNLEDASTHASVVFDLDGDGDLDIYDGNDLFAQGRADQVWVRIGTDPDGTPVFEPGAVPWGLDEETYRMGAVVADVDDDLLPDLYLTDVDPKRLYGLWQGVPLVDKARGIGLANDRRPDPARPGQNEALWGWGADLTDLDRDGFPDVFVVNGSVASEFSRTIFFQVPYVFRSRRGVTFDDVSEAAGLPPIEPFNRDLADQMWSRGAYAADLDDDGDRDYVLSSMLGPYRVLQNDSVRVGRTLRVTLRGTHSGPAATGTILYVTADGWTHAGFRASGGNTRGQGEEVVEVPLGGVRNVERVEVRWPSGLVQAFDRPVLGRNDTLTVTEPRFWAVDRRTVARGAELVVTATPPDERPLTATLGGLPLPLVPTPNGLEARVAHPGESGWRRLEFSSADFRWRTGASIRFE